LQENSGIFSDDRQETGILKISGARGSGYCIARERVHFALGVGITLVLVVDILVSENVVEALEGSHVTFLSSVAQA